jgi:hypothetical protein
VNRRILLVATVAAAVIVAAAAVQLSTNRSSAPASPQPTSTIPTSMSTATPTAASAIPAGAVEGSDTDATFTLRIRAESAVYRSGEPIEVQASLTYAGPKAREHLAASGTGLVLFSWEQLDGPRHIGIGGTDDCATYSIDRGKAMVVPFFKVGPPPELITDDIPDAPFWRVYFSDPVLRLPSGRYRVKANAGFYMRTCVAPRHGLQAGVEILVLP